MNLALFDVDGTLLDNLADEDACYFRALREQLALPMIDTDWSQYVHVSDDGISMQAYARHFGRPLPEELRAPTIERFVELLRIAHEETNPITMTAGVTELLDTLGARGWAVALATGAWKQAAEYKLHAAGVAYSGLPLATSEDGPARILIVQQAIARAAAMCDVAAFDRVVAIGDGTWDVTAARELALPFVGIGARADELRIAGASHILKDFVDIEATLRAFQTATVPHEPSEQVVTEAAGADHSVD